MSSLDTTMEGDSFVSNTDAIIYPTSDYSGWGGDSMISDPNIVLSSTSTDDRYQQQISTAAGGGDDDLMIESSAEVSSSWLNNNNKQSEIRIFNVDFRALTGVAVQSSPSYQLPQNNVPEFSIQGDELLQEEENVARLYGGPSSTIFRVSPASGRKDRHSKVLTAKGLKDRRVRLSITTAIQLYNLLDRLGYDQPSKTVEWLIKVATPSINELPHLEAPN